MYKISTVFSTILASATLLAAPNADALIITNTGDTAGNPSGALYSVFFDQTDVGSSFNLDWFVPAGTSGTTADQSAEATVSILSFSDNSFELGIEIMNTTAASVQAAIMGFGFGVEPDAQGSFSGGTGSTFDDVDEGQGGQQSFPGGFKSIDICSFAGNNCSGGNVKDGLQSGGQSDAFNLLIHSASTDAFAGGATLYSFPLKFQGEMGSFEPTGTPTTPGTPVPEPGTMLLLGSGLAAFAARRQRRLERGEA